MTRIARVRLLFASATRQQISAVLDEVAEQFQLTSTYPVEWCFPTTEQCCVAVSFANRALENDPERENIRAEVGTSPQTTLTLTVNSRVTRRATEAAKSLTVHLLSQFHGVADDGLSDDRIWTLAQIRETKSGVEFLHNYRDQSGSAE